MITSQTYLHKYFNSKPLDEYSWFKYELGWKVYSVDGHEKPATSEYHQKAFVSIIWHMRQECTIGSSQKKHKDR